MWIMEEFNVKALYTFVRKGNFKNILDLGTGIGMSTATIALAQKDKGYDDYVIHTVEQTQKCYKLAQQLIPEELRKNIVFHQIDPIIWNNPQIPYQPLSIFKELPPIPEGGWDLVVVDGPGPFLENNHYIDFPNGDVMKMLIQNELKAGVKIFFDGRLQSLKIIERFYSENFLLLDKMNNEYNILERKDNDILFEDITKLQLTHLGYFNYGEPKTEKST